jgi:hypothetical protein
MSATSNGSVMGSEHPRARLLAAASLAAAAIAVALRA